MIKQEVEALLMGKAEQKRIKEKVKHKQATFAQLKAEASKLL
jgi:ubiquitin